MGNCKNCEYWEAHSDLPGLQWNTCEAPNLVNRADKIEDDTFALYANAHDDSGLEWGLKTGPMFGCVKFKLLVVPNAEPPFPLDSTTMPKLEANAREACRDERQLMTVGYYPEEVPTNLNKLDWTLASAALPDIPEGTHSSRDVLGGCWIVYDWLRDDHPAKRRFIFGACRVLRTTDLEEFPLGKQWHTFGPSHNQITHWAYLVPPSA